LAGRVFVTGGTGFIGAYIIRELVKQGFSVRAMRRNGKHPFFISEEIWKMVDWSEGNVLDVVSLNEAMNGMDAVVHAAALVSFHRSDRDLMTRVNVEGTQNVVNAAIEQNLARFVHISSVAAIGRTDTGEKVSEEKKWIENRTNTHYAITKHAAELEVWRGFAEGLSGVILNPSTVLGYGDWHRSSSAIFRNVYKEFPWYTEGINGFTGVEDVASIAVSMLRSTFSEKRFIINSENWSFRKLFSEMAKGFGKKEPYRKASPLLGEIAWRLEKFKYLFSDGKPLLTKESARIAHSRTEFDNSALVKAIPNFKFTPLEDVIQQSCRKYESALREGLISL
jgi:nucleoside-diphosphate-sugar epimerase